MLTKHLAPYDRSQARFLLLARPDSHPSFRQGAGEIIQSQHFFARRFTMYNWLIDRLENGVRLMENSSPCSLYVSTRVFLDGSSGYYNVRIKVFIDISEGLVAAVQIPNSSIPNLVLCISYNP